MPRYDETWFRQFNKTILEGSSDPQECERWADENLASSFERSLNGKRDTRAQFVAHLSGVRRGSMRLTDIVGYIVQGHCISSRAYYDAEQDGQVTRAETQMAWLLGEDGKLCRMAEVFRIIPASEPVWTFPHRDWDQSQQGKIPHWTAERMARWIEESHTGGDATEADKWMQQWCERDLVGRSGDKVLGYEQLKAMLGSIQVNIKVTSTGWCVQAGCRVSTRIYLARGDAEEEQMRDMVFNPETGRLALLTMSTRQLAVDETHFVMTNA